MKIRLVLAALLIAALALLTGCSQRHKIEIQSDVCWDAVINGDQHLNDCGNVSYKVTGKLNCVVLQKQTANGYLRARIDGRAWTETTEQFGLIQICN